MAKLGISTGTTPNDGLGDNLLAGAVKINSNFSEIYTQFGDGTNLTSIGGTWASTSAGIHTLKNVGIGTTNPRFLLEVGAVGASGTTLFVNGDARITGIVTIGPASITLDGTTNIINVGTGITINGSTGIISATSIVLGGTTLTGAGVTSITAGSGISVDQSTGNVTITATGGGGSSQFVTTSAGIHTLSNVGIGTTNPTSALTVTGNAKIIGVVTATSFSGDGSGLTGVVGSGSGIVIKDSGSLVGTAGTIDFGDNLSVSTISAGVVTVTGSAGGGSSQWVTTGVGIHTLSNVGIGTTNPTSALTVKGNTSLETLSVSGVSTFVGVTTNQSTIFGTQLSVSGVSTFSSFITTPSLRDYNSLVGTASSTTTTFVVTVAAKTTNHRYYGTGSANAYVIDDIESPFITLLPGKTYRFTQEGASNSGHPLRFYYEAAKTTQYSTNVTTSGTPGTAGAYTEIVVTDTTPVVLHYQCSAHGYMGNAAQFNSNVVDTPYQITTSSGLSVSGVSTLTSNVSVGGTISVDGAVKLITNNGTIVGTSGSTGEIKRIAGAPFFYDGSAWREFVLSTGTPVAVPADTEWDNVILRSTYDTDSPGFFDFKFSEQPILTGTGATTVASPVKIGTKSFKNNGAVGAGISYAYRAEHDFTGPWTIEFWINHDGLPYNSSAYAESMVSQISSADTTNNWTFCVRYIEPTVYWVWNNEANANDDILYQVNYTTFDNDFKNQWNHYALVRESSNGSLHFYINGYEVGITTNNSIIDNEIISTNGAGLHIGGAIFININGEGVNGASSIDAHFDDLRITTDERYVSVGNTNTQVFVPSITALPTTGTLSSYVQPPGDKYGEIGLGTSPTWRGTSGVTVSQQSSGNYRVSFASTYTNSNDYFVLSHAMDQGFASYVGIARSTTHVDFAINKESDNAVVNTGSLSVQIKNHL
jgi:hypothetical protein